MLEFPDRENISWLLKTEKRDQFDVSYRMDSEEASRKRKSQDSLADDEIVKRSVAHNIPSASSLDQKRRRLREDSITIKSSNIEEGYNHGHHMRLDLELNLSPSLIDLNLHHDHDSSNSNKSYEEDHEIRKKTMEKRSELGLQTRKSMAWVAFDELDNDGCNRGDRDGGGGSEGEMVARVCMKCHMLVMLCKASPVCPNCKFMHSPEDTASLSLLFTPKPTLLA